MVEGGRKSSNIHSYLISEEGGIEHALSILPSVEGHATLRQQPEESKP